MAIIADSNQDTSIIYERLIDQIIAFKQKCNLEDRIGRRFNLSAREVSCLYLLSHNEMNSKDLSAGAGVSASRGSRLVQRLLSQEFVCARPDKTDRRNQLLKLSTKGKECLKALDEEKEACERYFLESLEAEQIEMVRKGMDLLMRVV